MKLCRIFGLDAIGKGASMFPDCVVFSFAWDEDRLDASGFYAAPEDAADRPDDEHAVPTTWLAETDVPRAKKAIVEEYGRRWKKIQVVTVDVGDSNVKFASPPPKRRPKGKKR